MNEDDSEQISTLLRQMGFSETKKQEEADVAILVTCSVREKPEQKAKSKLGKLRILKEKNPNMIIGLCGCMAQRKGKELRESIPYLDMIIGTASIHEIPEMINQIDIKRGFKHSLALPIEFDEPLVIPKRTKRNIENLKSFVPIVYGCNNFCSYCVVPLVRGRERSRSLADIVEEIRDLADNGRKDITLLGQNVNSYGNTLDETIDFAELLKNVNDIDGIERIRFTTSHPKDLSDKMIEAMKNLPKVCEHIHLAVQSGDDDVLLRMNRKYDSARIKERVNALRSAIPNIAITTDFLVGFPGETQEQYENTLKLAEEIRFDGAFMFAYNIIPNTAAEKMDDQIPKDIKNQRVDKLIKLQNIITLDINNSSVGQVYEVLVEGISPKHKGRITGLTRQSKTVNFEGSLDLVGKTVKVKTTEAHIYGFVGEMVDNCGN